MERTLKIETNPPGALVFIAKEEVGRTPLTMPFLWYGDYDVELRMEGYETLKSHYNVKPPLYEVPPLDLMSELAPWTYHVQRSAQFTLRPSPAPTTQDVEQLLKQAERMRERNIQPLPQEK